MSIGKLQVKSKILCFECSREVDVSSGGVKNFNDNLFISRLVDEFIIKCKCEECNYEDLAVSFCPDCIKFLCNIFNEYHKHSKVSRSHSIVLLTELRSKKDEEIRQNQHPWGHHLEAY